MLWLAPLALALDLWLADPKTLPHPVQAIGLAARLLEKPARKARNQRLAGALVMALLLALAGGITAFLISLDHGLGTLCALYLCWSGLALGGLARDGKAALAAIEEAEKNPLHLPAARKAAQMLVSRNTGEMDTDELYRSVAESVSENFNDAFVAPWFWLCLGGPVGLWLYKTASTMDSMWGYKNERWERLGWAAARLDDVLAFLPARLSVLCMLLAAFLQALPWTQGPEAVLRALRDRGRTRLPGWPGRRTVAAQARKSASPNAGWPMAAAAWLFHGRSGGLTPYEGVYVAKPLMGPQDGHWQADNTEALINHVRLAGIAGAAVSLAVAALV